MLGLLSYLNHLASPLANPWIDLNRSWWQRSTGFRMLLSAATAASASSRCCWGQNHYITPTAQAKPSSSRGAYITNYPSLPVSKGCGNAMCARLHLRAAWLSICLPTYANPHSHVITSVEGSDKQRKEEWVTLVGCWR